MQNVDSSARKLSYVMLGLLALDLILGLWVMSSAHYSTSSPFTASTPKIAIYAHAIAGLLTWLLAGHMAGVSRKLSMAKAKKLLHLGAGSITLALLSGLAFLGGGGKQNLFSDAMAVFFFLAVVGYIWFVVITSPLASQASEA